MTCLTARPRAGVEMRALLLVLVPALVLAADVRQPQPTVASGPSTRFSCTISAATVTTQCQAAPAAGQSIYVTDVTLSNNVATAQTLQLIFGTGAACVTSPVNVTQAYPWGTLISSFWVSFNTPIKLTAATALCVKPTAATSFSATISGYTAP